LNETLERKIKEFDSIRDSVMPGRDIDMLRLKIVEELEGPHKQQLRSLHMVSYRT
jgi:hypothetical protein